MSAPTSAVRDLIDRLKETRRPVVGCFPLYPPVELFHSMGLIPVVLWGLEGTVSTFRDSDRHVQQYACSIARRVTEFVVSDGGEALDALFAYNACDTLRNLPEIIAEALKERGSDLPFFSIHIPMAPRSQTDSSGYLGNEIEALVGKIEQTFGVSFSERRFLESTELYARARTLAQSVERLVAEGVLSFGVFAAVLQQHHWTPVEKQIEELESILRTAAAEGTSKGQSEPFARVIVSGIVPPPRKVSDLIEEAGLRVVANDIASLARSYAYNPAATGDPGDYYDDLYSNHHPCTTLLHTADRRVPAILNLAKRTQAEAFVFVGTKYCEYEYFEIPYLERRLRNNGIPTLSLELTADGLDNVGVLKTRIEAFAEVVTGNTGSVER